jgi:hypothetical protein
MFLCIYRLSTPSSEAASDSLSHAELALRQTFLRNLFVNLGVQIFGYKFKPNLKLWGFPVYHMHLLCSDKSSIHQLHVRSILRKFGVCVDVLTANYIWNS